MFFHNKVMGARLYPKNKYEKQRVIVACWLEDAGKRHSPSFVVMGLSNDGEALKITLPSDDWMLHLEGATDHQSILAAFHQSRKT